MTRGAGKPYVARPARQPRKRPLPAPYAPDPALAADPERLLRTREAAYYLGYTEVHMRKLRVANKGPRWVHLPDSRSVRYRLRDLRAFVSTEGGDA